MLKVDLADKGWESFEERDPFNPTNVVKGYIYKKEGAFYGSLYIEEINNIPSKQFIRGVPKFNYPFDKAGNWNFPPTKYINIYMKADGSVIFAYEIKFKDRRYVSYKTRLQPFLKNGKFNNFLDLWKEMLERYPDIPEMILQTNVNLAFELCGYRNPHLIEYPFDLDAFFIFGIDRNTSELLDHEEVQWHKSNRFPNKAPFEGQLKKGDDFQKRYKEIQYLKEQKLKLNEATNLYRGEEGSMLYCHTVDDRVVVLKLKPETIEKIHWASGDIDKNSIRATIMNAFESWDEPNHDNVIALLAEEYSDRQIARMKDIIEKELDLAIKHKVFVSEVLGRFIGAFAGISYNDLNKRVVMGYLSKFYVKSEMNKVYNALKEGGIPFDNGY